jgi:hypothetical protein
MTQSDIHFTGMAHGALPRGVYGDPDERIVMQSTPGVSFSGRLPTVSLWLY